MNMATSFVFRFSPAQFLSQVSSVECVISDTPGSIFALSRS